MEFFKEVHSPGLKLTQLKGLLTIDSLAQRCASINTVTALKKNEGNIYCVWGAFKVRREEIKYGVRFSLLDCPHALAWTVTYDAESQNTVIHCTIDKTETDPDFVESIHEFVADWSNGIAQSL